MVLQAMVSSKAFLLPIFLHLRAVAKSLTLPTLDASEADESDTLSQEQMVEEERVLMALLQQLAESTGSLAALPLKHVRQLASRVAFAALTRSDMITFDAVTRENGLVSLTMRSDDCLFSP